jgi:tellurite methyltransferase
VSNPPENARRRWNRRYTERGVRAFENAPAPWLVEHRPLLMGNRGRPALDVACGDGRNAAYLAELGFEVDAVDVSDVAIDALRAAALSSGLTVHPRRIDLERCELPAARYDVIVQMNYLQRELFGPLAQALKPGGLLILETFTRADAGAHGHSLDSQFLLDHNELLASFPELDVLDHREAVITHGGMPRALAGLVAQRPPTADGR